ncbi:nucleolar protein 16-like isoform X2 [Aristolochia californica]|uniref:nucleolar protein 16-like isoform X2 n=1 Tax=Aristolochia californica TaxID=171875 RepID=UPI0035DFFA20
MGGSRRRLKKSRSKVRIALPRKKPHVFKPSFTIPPKLRSLIAPEGTQWDETASVLDNYRSFGVVSNPNLVGALSRTSQKIESVSLQVPPAPDSINLDDVDSGSDLEEDDLKSALGKKRRDGKKAPMQPLTAIQRVYVARLIEKYGDDYARMFRDTKLNSMQHSVAFLKNLCQRFCIKSNPILRLKT